MIREERIGGCRLILGDSREIVPSLGVLGAVVSDPPYGMAFQSGGRKEPHRRIAGDQDAALLGWAAGLEPAHSKYLWMRWVNLGDVPRPKSLITWIKPNHSMGDLDHEHGRQTEVCAFWPGPRHRFPGKRPSDVVKAPITNNVHHPTEKPVGLMEVVISWTEGLVVDPFMGSGTTLVAAARLRREAIGVEIDPIYFETACRRVEAAVASPTLL